MTVISLLMAYDVLQPLESLNRSLQSVNMSVGGMLEAITTVKSYLVQKRSDEHFAEVLSQAEVKIETLGLEPPRLPRQRKTLVRFGGSSAEFHAASVADHLRIEYFKILDFSITQLTERFTNSAGLKRYSELELILRSGEVSNVALNYPELGTKLEDLQLELAMFRKTQKLDNLSSHAILNQYVLKLSGMSKEVRNMFPKVEELTKLLLVNPASSASAERSFSSLRRLKTYLRSTIGQMRLNNVAVCHVHKHILDEIDQTEIMRQYVQFKPNRQAIFGKM